ncbi:MAG: carboxypeptidase regulatory-like domain-containing protein [Fibrobacteres bacterium]|jgi:hypothetical protein|nr:carboxypeptidase regulatory-like domain-containing protein [Fibrobacterota bacterium]
MRIVPISRILLITFGLPVFAMTAHARQQRLFAASDTTAMVRGTVSDDAGLPLAGVKVVATAKVFKEDPPREILGQDSVFTSDSGKYVFPALDLNTVYSNGSNTNYYLTFSKPGYRQGYSNSYDLPPLNPGDTDTFDIHLAKVLDLTVIVKKAGAPESSAAGASVVLSPYPAGARPNYRYGFVPASGIVSFVDVDGGDKTLTVALDGYKPMVLLKSISELKSGDSVQVLLEKSNPDSVRTLIVKLQGLGYYGSSDTMIFSSADYLHMNLLAIADSDVITFRNIPDSCSSGTLTAGTYTDTTTLSGPVTQKKFWFYNRTSIPISRAPGIRKKSEIPGPVPFFFDGKSGRSYNILGRPRAPSSKPVEKEIVPVDNSQTR